VGSVMDASLYVSEIPGYSREHHSRRLPRMQNTFRRH
jgi:hypothetical protein